MKSMLSVRFEPRMRQRVEELASNDKVTVSEWMRRVVERELRMRVAADFRDYPMTATTASSVTSVVIPSPQTYTGH